MANENRITPEMQRRLKVLESTPTFHSMLDITPSECTWIIPVNDMARYIEKMANKMLGDGSVYSVSIDAHYKTKRPPIVCIWLNKDSRHLIDTRRNDNTQVFTPRVEKYSQELINFANQFAPTTDDNDRPIKPKNRIQRTDDRYGNPNIVGIRIDMTRVLERLFDVQNYDFREIYGNNASQARCQLKVGCIYRQNENNGSATVAAIRVTKKPMDARQKNSTPHANFKDGRRHDEYKKHDDDNIGRERNRNRNRADDFAD